MDPIYPDGFNNYTETREENKKAVEVSKKILQVMEDEGLAFEDAYKAMGFANNRLNQAMLRTQIKIRCGEQV